MQNVLATFFCDSLDCTGTGFGDDAGDGHGHGDRDGDFGCFYKTINICCFCCSSRKNNNKTNLNECGLHFVCVLRSGKGADEHAMTAEICLSQLV